jgi:hypothetical protein
MVNQELDRLRDFVIGNIAAVEGRVRIEPVFESTQLAASMEGWETRTAKLADLLFAHEHSLSNIQFVNLGKQVLWAVQMEISQLAPDCPPRKQLLIQADRINQRLRCRGLS